MWSGSPRTAGRALVERVLQRGAAPSVRIARPRLVTRGGTTRVSARVDGEDAWFESAEAPLRAAPEAFAAAFLLPALHRGATLEIDAALDPVFQANVRRLLPIYRSWWGYPERPPVSASAWQPEAGPAEATPRRRGLFFTGGVDSFHALLQLEPGAECLVYVEGFDVDLDDEVRLAEVDASLRAVAEGLGKTLVRVRSNLREHRRFRRGPGWGNSHGAALAAVAHVLSPLLESLVVPATYWTGNPEPWGSHWQTDALYSGSLVALRHGDASLVRRRRIEAIAGHPLVQRHLRVCWQSRGSGANCSRCEKCLRTLISLESTGLRERFALFDPRLPLAAALDALPPLEGSMDGLWPEPDEVSLGPDTRDAFERLLRRSRPWPFRTRLLRRRPAR